MKKEEEESTILRRQITKKRGDGETGSKKCPKPREFIKKYFFWCDLPHLAVFYSFCYFSAIKWSIFFHLVFSWSRDLNPRQRTMIVIPWRSPLDNGGFFIYGWPLIMVSWQCRRRFQVAGSLFSNMGFFWFSTMLRAGVSNMRPAAHYD